MTENTKNKQLSPVRSTADAKLSGSRTGDKIENLSVVGHGVPGDLAFGYDYKPTTSAEEQQQIKEVQI